MRVGVLLATVAGVTADLRLTHRGHSFLAADLQPDAVARTLLEVEDQWHIQAADSARSNSTNSAVSFQKSCSTVVNAIVQASSGDRKRVTEYMDVVCSQSQLQGWHQNRCQDLALAVSNAMIYDQGGNREYVNAMDVCGGYWSRFIVEEESRAEQERLEEAARAKEAEAKRLQEEKEAAARAADEQKRQEEEEAERKREEAKRQAEEAAAQLAAKKAEAEHQAEEAKKQLEQAQQVAEEAARHHKEAMEKVVNATQNLTKRNVTNITAVPINKTQPSTNNTTTK